MPPPSVFIVEDELIEAEDIRQTLEKQGYSVAGVARSGESVLETLQEIRPDLVLMDIHLAGSLDGIDTAEQIRTRYHIPIIFLTSFVDETSLGRAKVTEPYGYVLKPFDERELHSAIEMALYKHRMEEVARENEQTIQALVNALPDAVMLLDHNCQIIALNDAMASRFGYRYNQKEGDSPVLFDRTGMVSSLENQIPHLLQSNRPVHFEEKDQDEWFDISYILIPATEGHRHRFLIQYHDITDYKQLEKQLRKEGITRIERNMEQFQILNDQIRNPLQAIRGFVDLNCVQYRERIIEQIMLIDSLVDRLDRGWVESEKVRRFLIRHYLGGDSQNPGYDENEGGQI
jgi:two-component system, response regulator PdtaR